MPLSKKTMACASAPECAPQQLCDAIKTFNALDADHDALMRLMCLAKVLTILDSVTLTPPLHHWMRLHGPDGLEAQLLGFGIHKDASPLLCSYEISKAALVLSQAKPVSSTHALHQYYRAYAHIMEIEKWTKEDQAAFLRLAQAHVHVCEHSLKKAIAEHSHILALLYGKIETMRNRLRHEAEKYRTEKLMGENNKNFRVLIKDFPLPLVIRVEDTDKGPLESKIRPLPAMEAVEYGRVSP